MEINVPRPKATPMEATVGSDAISPIKNPAQVKIVPEVKIVGNAWFKDSVIASLIGILCFRSMYLLEITIA